MELMKRLPLLTFILLLLYSKNKVDGQFEPARNISLCVQHIDPILSSNDQLKEFIPIIMTMEETNDYYNPIKLTDKSKPEHKILDTIRFSKIKLNMRKAAAVLIGGRPAFPHMTEYILTDQPLGDSDVFNQWIHIRIKAKVKLAAVIVGAMHGPFGLPTGTFVGFKGELGKRCGCENTQTDVGNFVAIPCTLKARASVTHPDVFVWHKDVEYLFKEKNKVTGVGGIRPSGLPKDEISFNFNFLDIKCNRVSLLQFFVIAVEAFGPPANVEAVVTPVFRRPKPTSTDGTAYPFHQDFCVGLECGDPTVLKPDFALPELDFTSNATLRYSSEYDLCIRSAVRGIKNCPPGPFKCNDPTPPPNGGDIDPDDAATLNAVAADLSKEANRVDDASNDVCSCAVGNNETAVFPSVRQIDPFTTHPPWIDTVLNENQRTNPPPSTSTIPYNGTAATKLPFNTLGDTIRKNIEAQRNLRVKTDRLRIIHAELMFFAFSICGSISIFIVRFDKDLKPGVGCCGRGIWLWVHILLAFSSMIAMWGGLLFLAPTRSSEEQGYGWKLKPLHVFFGTVAMIFFNLIFFTGWIRPVGRIHRGIFISVHSIVGYSAKLCGALPMFIISEQHFFSIIIVLVTEFVNLLFYGANTVIQVLTDSHMEIRTPRKVCPYLEHKELHGPVPATCNMARNLIMLLHAAALTLCFIITISLWPTDYRVRSLYDILIPGHWGETIEVQVNGTTSTTTARTTTVKFASER